MDTKNSLISFSPSACWFCLRLWPRLFKIDNSPAKFNLSGSETKDNYIKFLLRIILRNQFIIGNSTKRFRFEIGTVLDSSCSLIWYHIHWIFHFSATFGKENKMFGNPKTSLVGQYPIIGMNALKYHWNFWT